MTDINRARAIQRATQALFDAGMELLVKDAELLADFVQAGGSFHGPNIETATIPVEQLVPFLRKLRAKTETENQP